MKKYFLCGMAVLLMITLLLENSPVTAGAKTPTATKSVSVTAGSSKKITVKGSYIKSKKYKSSNTKIASVNTGGKVTGKKAGKCTITITVKYRKTKKAKKISKKTLRTKVIVSKKKASVLPQNTNTPPQKTPQVVINNSKNEDESKNLKDVEALRNLIKQQKALGANLSDNINDTCYGWNDEGRLEKIDWTGKQLSGNISFSMFPALEILYCYDNQLHSLDVGECTFLRYLYCGSNQITTLDVSNCKSLKELSCLNNSLKKLDVINCVLLQKIYCDSSCKVSNYPEKCVLLYSSVS